MAPQRLVEPDGQVTDPDPGGVIHRDGDGGGGAHDPHFPDPLSSGRNSVRMRHLAARPAVSATYLPGDEFAVTVHGRAELADLRDAADGELRQAMLDHYLPRQGPQFETWLDEIDGLAARIAPEKMFTFATNG